MIIRQAQKMQSPIQILGKDFDVKDNGEKNWSQYFDFSSGDFHLDQVQTSLIGDYQTHNAALAIQAYIEYESLHQRKADPKSSKRALSQLVGPADLKEFRQIRQLSWTVPTTFPL